MADFQGWQLDLLGDAQLSRAGSALTLDRKTGAVLAYLAFEGPTRRSRLAGLLWPSSKESTARNNLVQLLRKLRLTAGDELTAGADVVHLSPTLQVRTLETRELHLLGRHEEFAATTDELLGAYDYDDCPEFEEWLVAERERWHESRRASLQALITQADLRRDDVAARHWAEQLLQTDPASEEAFAQVMKYQYLLGDRVAALDTWRRCELTLRREFGAVPLDSTRAMADTILQGQHLAQRMAPRPRNIPLAVLRPPVLAGREREWELMEAAWARGQGIILSGPPGVGKSRLMMEFAASKGAHISLNGRPGDQAVPYGTYARVWRDLLRGREDLVIPDWVRREFSRLVPELWPGDPPALASPSEKARFLEATAEMARLISQGVAVALADDMQYYDAASMELGAYIGSRFVPFSSETGAAHNISATRRGEMDPEAEAKLRAMVDAGLGVWIDLDPLDERAVKSILLSLNVPDVSRHSEQLSNLSGGNPLFLLETVKHLYETDLLTGEALSPLPVPQKVQAVIGERLARLSPAARQVAHAAATLQSDVTLDLTAEVLNAPLLEVIPAWDELENAQILAGGRFSHDLIYETVRAGMPETVRAALHRSAARTLERHGVGAARIAQHWLAGGEHARAVPKLMEAAGQARAAMRFVEAAEYYEQAVDVLEARGERDAAFDHLVLLVRDLLKEFDLGERYERALDRLFGLARTAGQQAQAWHCRSMLHSRRGDHAAAAAAARQGLQFADLSNDLNVQAQLAQMLGIALLHQDALPEAATMLERAAGLNGRLGNVSGRLSALQNLGVIQGKLGRLQEASKQFQAVAEESVHADRPVLRLHALSNLALALGRRGLKHQGYALAVEAWHLVQGMQGRAMNQVLALLTLAELARDLERYAESLDWAEQARAASRAYNGFAMAIVLGQQAATYLAMGAREPARECLNAARITPDLPAEERAALLRLQVAAQGEATEELRGELGVLRAQLSPRDALLGELTLLQAYAPDAALTASAGVLATARAGEARDVHLLAAAQHAHLHLQSGDAEVALEAAREALSLLEAHEPTGWSRTRLLGLHSAALCAAGQPDAARSVQAARVAAAAVAAEHVPPAYQAGYLATVLSDLPAQGETPLTPQLH